MKQEFCDYIFSTNTDGSGKAASYVRALDMLGPILTKHYPQKIINGSMWHSFTPDDLEALHKWICEEMRKGESSCVLPEFESPSYWTKNFCSAAVDAYREFMAANHFENAVVASATEKTVGADVAKAANHILKKDAGAYLEKYIVEPRQGGKERIAAVRTRVSQDIFRKMVLMNFNRKCCLTGIDVPEVLRASHISAWAEDEANRLNPENGLCLSATYDAAFDQHLISFDEDYRLIIAKSAKEHYTSEAFKTWFSYMEGTALATPVKFKPSQRLLEKHRSAMI